MNYLFYSENDRVRVSRFAETLANAIKAWWDENGERIKAAVVQALKTVWKCVKEVFSKVLAIAKKVWPLVKKIVLDTVNGIKTFWGKYGKQILKVVSDVFTRLWTIIKSAFDVISNAVLKFLNYVEPLFTENITTDNEEEMSLQIRISELDAEIKAMISSVSADTIDDFDEEKAQSLMSEKNELQNKLEELYGNKARKEAVQSRLQDVYAIMDGLKNHQIVYNDELVRQIIEVVIVESKEKIKIIFKGGLKVEENL